MSAIMTGYQEYIHKSKYARWDYEKERRETWGETVDRYINYMRKQVDAPDDIWEASRASILNLEVMPSMRAMMTAGEPLDRCNVPAFNCAYAPVNSLRTFDEALYILMCGTGLGFSVEEKYTHQLPTVPNELLKEGSIVVQDSKEGWAKAFRTFLHYAFNKGIILEMDVSLVRPAGEVLKTFGGRASGPKPFLELISFVTNIIQGAKGRRLTTLECHDIMCKIAQIVVVGGVEPKIN